MCVFFLFAHILRGHTPCFPKISEDLSLRHGLSEFLSYVNSDQGIVFLVGVLLYFLLEREMPIDLLFVLIPDALVFLEVVQVPSLLKLFSIHLELWWLGLGWSREWSHWPICFLFSLKFAFCIIWIVFLGFNKSTWEDLLIQVIFTSLFFDNSLAWSAPFSICSILLGRKSRRQPLVARLILSFVELQPLVDFWTNVIEIIICDFFVSYAFVVKFFHWLFRCFISSKLHFVWRFAKLRHGVS